MNGPCRAIEAARSALFICLMSTASARADGPQVPLANEQLYSDAFTSGADQKVGETLDKRRLEAGEAVWAVTGGKLVTIEGGGVTAVGVGGATAVQTLPRIAGQITVSAEFRLTGVQSCCGVGVGRNLGGNFFKEGEIVLLVGPKGWELSAPALGEKRLLASGKMNKIPDFKVDEFTRAELEIDTIRKTVSARVNGVAVADKIDLMTTPIKLQAGAAGFRINGPVTPNDVVVKNYRVRLMPEGIAGLSVSDAASFVVAPDQESTWSWRAESTGRSSEVPFEITDYQGKSVAHGIAAVSGDHIVTATARLPAGYYELKFVQTGDVFGILAAAPLAGVADPFFGIDAAMTQLTPNTDTRAGLIRLIERSGISVARERLSLGVITGDKGVWNWDGRGHEQVRQTYADHHIKVLDIVAGGVGKPQFGIDKPSGYPLNYANYAQSMATVVGHMESRWAGWEVWNEPDQGPTPSDQYATLVKVAAFAANQAKSKVPVVSGVFAKAPPGAFFDTCAANGMLEASDAVSLHSYDPATAMQSLIGRYREWLKASGNESMPLWITECGKQWLFGPARAPINEDFATACEITMKGVEAKACGAAAYFPFVLVDYSEGKARSFGMTGPEATPMRSFAAYAKSALTLAGANYLGDLKIDDPAVVRARVFSTRDGRRVVMLYTGQSGIETKVLLPFAPGVVEGIDGRALKLSDDGKTPVPDGIAYVWGDPAVVDKLLVADTPAAALLATSRLAVNRPRASSPIVLQFKIDPASLRMSPRRYTMLPELVAAAPIAVRVHNLGQTPQKVTLRLELPGEQGKLIPGSEPVEVEIPAMSSTEASWKVDLSRVLDVAQVRFLMIRAQSAGAGNITPLAIPMVTDGDLAVHLARHNLQIRIPTVDLANWQANQAAHGTPKFSQAEGNFRMDITFSKKSGNWAFPKINVPAGTDLSAVHGILVRARLTNWSRNVGLLVWLTGGKERFESLDLFPPDGQWHVVYVPLEELKPSSDHPDAQNARFDPTRLETLAVGMTTAGDHNQLDISDLILVGD